MDIGVKRERQNIDDDRIIVFYGGTVALTAPSTPRNEEKLGPEGRKWPRASGVPVSAQNTSE